MKRNVRKPDSPKKPRKVARCTGRKLKANETEIEPWWFLESPEEWTKLRRKWKLRDLIALLAFGLEPEDIPPKVNRSKREAGLTEPAPLPVADAIGGEHPGAFGITTAQFTKLMDNFMMLHKNDGRLLARFTARQSELDARVALAEAALERLVHDQAKCFEFIHGGAACPPADFPPGQEVSAKLAAYLARHSAPTDAQEIGHGAPLDQDAGVSQGAVGVPLVKEAGNPVGERLAYRNLTQGTLDQCSMITHPSRLSRFVRKCVAQVRRLLDACARRITELEPPI